MSTNCLSSATILRCAALERGQNGIIFIPAVIQVMAIGGLSLRFWNFGSRKHYWLIVDSWAFLLLALIDLLSHQVDSARTSLRVFKIFDIVLGAISFVPILFYMSFLYVLARSYCLPLLPRLVRKVSKYALLVLIPVTIATNELGSFIGISYRVQQGDLTIGFSTSGNQQLWLFFTSVTLVVLITFQVVIFCFSFYLVLRLFLDTRQPPQSSRSSLASVEIQIPSLRGISWIAVGAKLGVVETLLGFVDGGFAVVLVRRILRMLSRVCLVYGILKADSPRSLGREPSLTQIRGLISNPRASTFARLSPSATGFYSQPRANMLYGPRPIPGEPQTQMQAANTRRVTVVYDGLTPPALNLRLSGLGLPSPEALADRFNKRGTMLPSREGSNMSFTGSSTPPSLSAIASAQRASLSGLPKELEIVTRARARTMSAGESLGSGNGDAKSLSLRPNPKFSQEEWENGRNPILAHARFMSASSLASDSLSMVQELASQFPGIPPRQTFSSRYQSMYGERRPSVPALDQVEEEAAKSDTGHSRSQSQAITPSNSLKRKAPPPIPDDVQFSNPFEIEDLDRSDSKKSKNSNDSHSSSLKRKGAPPPIDPVRAQADSDIALHVRVRTDSDRNTEYDNNLTTRTSTATPGLSFGTNSSRLTTPRTPPRNPFRDGGSDYNLHESEMLVEGGLSNIAARVAEYDRQRMASFRGVPGTAARTPDSPVSVLDGRDKKGKSPIRMPPVAFPMRNSSPISISSPRRLSAGMGTPRSRTSSNNTATMTMADTAIESVRREQWKGGNLTRIKSVGQVSSRRTPAPTPSTASPMRQSMRVDEADFLDLSRRGSPLSQTPSPSADEGRRSSAGTGSAPRSPLQRKLKKMDRTVRDVESSSVYSRSYAERRTRRESEGEWEM